MKPAFSTLLQKIQPWKPVLSHFSLNHILITYLINSCFHNILLSTPQFPRCSRFIENPVRIYYLRCCYMSNPSH
jgi:hypothetical protein